jgi:hypothetical protein
MESLDFTLSDEPTALISLGASGDKEVFTIVISNEMDSSEVFSVNWSDQVLYSGEVLPRTAIALFDGQTFIHESNEELSATGMGLTLHMVLGDYNG